jgi:hypothetical protein
MKKFIVPTKDKIQTWMSFFSAAGQTEEYQKDLMQSMIMMSMSLAYDDHNNQNQFFELYENTLVMSLDLVSRGLIYEDEADGAAQTAYDFCVDLVGYLKELEILGRIPTAMQFEGLVNMNMVISVLAAGEPYVNEMEERACLSG